MRKYQIKDKTGTDIIVFRAKDKKEAYFMFIEQCLGIKLTEFQKEDSLKEIVVGNYIFDVADCEEILE